MHTCHLSSSFHAWNDAPLTARVVPFNASPDASYPSPDASDGGGLPSAAVTHDHHAADLGRKLKKNTSWGPRRRRGEPIGLLMMMMLMMMMMVMVYIISFPDTCFFLVTWDMTD